MRHVAIYLYDEVEVLDFAGPFEVFSTASRVYERLYPGREPPFRVFTVARTPALVQARGGLLVTPAYTFADHPPIDLLLVPGGVVTTEIERTEVVAWVKNCVARTELAASVCTGSFILGKAGLLANKRATTHWEDITDLRALLPDTHVLENIRYVDEGKVVTSAGISAGLDMSLYLIARLAGRELAVRTARQMDYDWKETS
ncbi:MAG: DJ-1/PfpI family protein [candidate division Zixibacteria bacterium]|nr:DJ-1/PfpI family protein [candidate division Zixibacteria bacterium]